jgi:hypothetical protein
MSMTVFVRTAVRFALAACLLVSANTSEFIDVKKRLAALEGGMRVNDASPHRPRLRRGTGIDGEMSQPDQDERPTLKRRD